MICLFVLLVAGLLLAVAVQVGAEYRALRLRALLTDRPQAPGPLAPCQHALPAPAAQHVVGLHAEAAADGVHLEFYLPPNHRGVTSPITQLVSTRQRDEHGTLYALTTASGSSYLVSLSDERARQVLRTFFAWKNGRSHLPEKTALPASG
jgi:hypothetical protein